MSTALVGLLGFYCPFCSKAAAAAAPSGPVSGHALVSGTQPSSSSFPSCCIVGAMIRVVAAACIVRGFVGQYSHSACDQAAGIIDMQTYIWMCDGQKPLRLRRCLLRVGFVRRYLRSEPCHLKLRTPTILPITLSLFMKACFRRKSGDSCCCYGILRRMGLECYYKLCGKIR